jgi:hypothetical protein
MVLEGKAREDGGEMSVRLRGLLKMSGCAVAGIALFWFRSGLLVQGAAGGGLLGELIKWLLVLPVVGAAIGLVELATGLPIQQADTAWQKAPGLVKYPAAIVASGLFLWGFLWAVSKALGA